MINRIIEEIFPAKCLICDIKNKEHLCESCKRKVEKLVDSKCYFVSELGDIIYYYGKYLGPIRTLVKSLKYSRKIPASKIIAKYLKLIIEERFTIKPSLILPVPLSLGKELKRKYNQCDLICEEVSKLTKIRHKSSILNRKVELFEKDQIRLSRAERIMNLDNSFYIDKASIDMLPNTVILLDDVATTGKTIHSCIQVIKNVKPDIKIYPLVFAH